MTKWTLKSWESYPIKQKVEYKDKEALQKTLTKINTLPSLVSYKEVA